MCALRIEREGKNDYSTVDFSSIRKLHTVPLRLRYKVLLQKCYLHTQTQEITMSMSAEPGRKKAYSKDLHWRIVYQRIGMNFTYERIGKNLNISMSTVHRTYKIFLTTGNVDPVLCTRRAQLRKLDERSELYVIGLVFARPSLYLGYGRFGGDS